jgi:hypothetical protein
MEGAMQVNTHRNEANPSRWWGLALLCGAFFVVISAVIVTVALPSRDPDFSLRWGWSAALLLRSHGGSYPSGRGADFGSIFDSPTASVAALADVPERESPVASVVSNTRGPCRDPAGASPARAGTRDRGSVRGVTI